MTLPDPTPATLTAPTSAVERFRHTVLQARGGVRDVALGLVPQGVAAVTGFVGSVLMARGLGPARLGDYALVMSVAGLATSLSDLGIGQTAIRFASRAAAFGETDRQFAILRWAFRVRMTLVCIITLVFFLLAPLLAHRVWHVSGLTPLIRLGLLAGVFTALAAVPIVYFQSVRRFGMNAAISSAQILVGFSGIVAIAVLHRWSVGVVLGVSLIASAIAAVAFLSTVPRRALIAGDTSDFRRTSWLDFWKSPSGTSSVSPLDDRETAAGFARFHLVSSVIVMIIQRLDIWLQGIFVTRDQIGVYNAAGRFTLPLVMLLGATTAALWPRASATVAPDEVRALLIKTLRLTSLTAFGALIYAALVPRLAPALFGGGYAGSVLLGQLLSLRYVLAILGAPLGVIGYSLGLVRVYWLINILQLTIVLVINLVLLPRVGPMGSAIAYLANELVGLGTVGTLTWRRLAVSSRRPSNER
jgi:O-antigen/teichoic acid export membrane protein